jgi:hypothetical protein
MPTNLRVIFLPDKNIFTYFTKRLEFSYIYILNNLLITIICLKPTTV